MRHIGFTCCSTPGCRRILCVSIIRTTFVAQFNGRLTCFLDDSMWLRQPSFAPLQVTRLSCVYRNKRDVRLSRQLTHKFRSHSHSHPRHHQDKTLYNSHPRHHQDKTLNNSRFSKSTHAAKPPPRSSSNPFNNRLVPTWYTYQDHLRNHSTATLSHHDQFHCRPQLQNSLCHQPHHL